LFSVKEVFEWKGNKPSNVTFYKEGKCIFQAVSHDKIIYVSNKMILNELSNLNYIYYYEENEAFKNINYPYEGNNDKYIVI
jgi:hypothetical protein